MRVYSNIDAIKRRVNPSKRQGTEWVWGGFLAIALSLSLLFFAVERMLLSKIKYEVAQAEVLQQDLRQVNQRLLLEKASLESPSRLAREGRKLGLRPPRKEQVVPIEVR